MRYMIDTNIFIFACTNPNELDANVTALLEDCENTFIISTESIREVVLLNKKGGINTKIWRSYADIRSSLKERGIEIRHVGDKHLQKLFVLEPVRDHHDPADLMIISQAITENIDLISSDKEFEKYMPQGLKFIRNHR